MNVSAIGGSIDVEKAEEAVDEAGKLVFGSAALEAIEVVSTIHEFGASLATDAGNKNVGFISDLNRNRLLEGTSYCAKYMAIFTIPWAIFGIKGAVSEMKSDKLNGRINLVSNVGWLASSIASAAHLLSKVVSVTTTAGKVFEKMAPPFAAVSSVCSVVGAVFTFKRACGYAKEARELKSVAALGDIEKRFGIKDYKADETHKEAFKKRLFSMALTGKAKAIAAVVSIIGVALLLFTPMVVIPATLFVVGSLIEFGSVIYNKWAENRLVKDLGREVGKIDRLALTAGIVSIVALPLLFLSSFAQDGIKN